MVRTNAALLSALTAAALSGCIIVTPEDGKKGRNGTDDPTAVETTDPTTTDPGTPVVETDVDVLCTGTIEELASPIDVDTTLTPEHCYRLADMVEVSSGATLTLQAGVTLVADEDAGLTVSSGGGLIAAGTPTAPVSFVGSEPLPGWWTGVMVASDAGQNTLSEVTIAHAGSRTWYTDQAASLHARAGGGFTLDGVRLLHGGDVGLSLEAGSDTGGIITGLEVHDHAGHAMVLYPAHVPAVGPDNRLSADGSATTAWMRTGDFPAGDVRWEALDVPWEIDGIVETAGTDLTLAPDLELAFRLDAGLYIDEDGLLLADGTEGRITLRGTEPGAAWWTGLIVESREAGSHLTNVDLSGGGSRTWYSPDRAQVMAEGQLALHGVTVADAGGYAVAVDRDGGLTGFTDNTLSASELGAMRIGADDLTMLDASTAYGDPVYVRDEDAVGSVGTWAALDQPVVFEGITELVDADLQVDPGAWLWFAPDAGLDFDASSNVVMEGTVDAPIVLEGEIGAPGTWTGVIVRSLQTGNLLSHVEIHHAGSRTFYTSEPAGIYLDGTARLTVDNTLVADSAGWGVYAEDSATLDIDPGSCSFAGNVEGDVRQ